MRRVLLSASISLLIAGCSLNSSIQDNNSYGDIPPDGVQIRPVARPEALNTVIPATATTVEEFDTTTAEQRSEAVAAAPNPVAEKDLGLTIASLGSPAEPGFWLKTPLVDAPSKGRVMFAETDKSVAVDLIPIDGPKTAGSRLSLAAMRLIEAPLTGLPEIRVFQNGS